jgi:thymidylate kinase
VTEQVTELTAKPTPPSFMRRRFLVSISGIDGSGKSSNTKALCENLRKKGFSVTRAWTGNKPILSYPFFAIVRMLGYTHKLKLQGIVFFRREIQQNPALATLWPFFVVLDFVLRGIVSVVIPLRRGRVVVSDRYVYDVLAELIQEARIGKRTRNILLNFFPRPDIAFLMDVTPELAWKRGLVPGKPREQPYYDMAERRRIYRDLARQNRMVILDGSRDVSINEKDVLQWTLEAIGAPGQS